MGKTKKIKAVGYYRTSGKTGESNKGLGYSLQRKEVREYCKTNRIELVGEYFDNGISGTKFSESYQLIEMLDYLNTNDVDLVVSKSSCRLFGRGEVRVALTKRDLKKKGVKVKLTDNLSYDLWSTDPTERFHNRIMEILDEYEKERLVGKLASARRVRASNGKKPSGSYPLGYMKHVDYSKNKKGDVETVINPKTKPIVEYLFENYNPDHRDTTLAGLARYVKKTWGNEDIVPEDRVTLSPSGVRTILMNRWYIGWVKHGNMPEVKGTHEIFITPKRFGMVRKMLAKNIR